MSETEMYLNWILENLNEVDSLKKECEYFSIIYKKRVFEEKWPKDIQDILNRLRKEIKKELDECQYYLQRIKELKNDKTSQSQSIENKENVGVKRVDPRDTNKDITGVK